MNVQLDTREVQEAITEYLRRRGVLVEDANQVQLEIISHAGGRINLVGSSPVVVVNNVKLPEGGPYRG